MQALLAHDISYGLVEPQQRQVNYAVQNAYNMPIIDPWYENNNLLTQTWSYWWDWPWNWGKDDTKPEEEKPTPVPGDPVESEANGIFTNILYLALIIGAGYLIYKAV